MALSSVFRSLRHRNFLLFFAGQLISLIGTWMQTVAQSWLVYRITGSALLLGTVSFASQIPVFILSPIGGAVADRYNRHRVVIATQSISMILALILAALTFTDVVREWHIIVLAAALGVVNAFDIPARQAFIVEMVSREDMTNAIALNSSMFNGARVVGPAVAGILVARIGEAWCFLANGLSYIAVIIGLLMMEVNFRRRPAETSAFEHIREGFTYVLGTTPILTLLVVVGSISFAGMPYSVLMPIFADQILHGGAQALGTLMGASGVGALVGALFIASRTSVKGFGRLIVIMSIAFGASLIVFAYSRLMPLSLGIMIVAGGAMMTQMASCNTLIQSMVRDELRGRVMSVYSMMFMGTAPIGAFLAGALARVLGAPMIVAAGGAVCIVAGVWFGWRLPSIRPIAQKLIRDQSALVNAVEQQAMQNG